MFEIYDEMWIETQDVENAGVLMVSLPHKGAAAGSHARSRNPFWLALDFSGEVVGYGRMEFVAAIKGTSVFAASQARPGRRLAPALSDAVRLVWSRLLANPE